MYWFFGVLWFILFFYYGLRGGGWLYCLLVASLILPIAVLANMVRITLLVLLTYYFGDAVAQGFLHSTAGFLLFALALALIFAADALLGRLFQLREAGL